MFFYVELFALDHTRISKSKYGLNLTNMIEEKPNYQSAYWQNTSWKNQLKEMIRNPASINEIGFFNFPFEILDVIFYKKKLNKKNRKLNSVCKFYKYK